MPGGDAGCPVEGESHPTPKPGEGTRESGCWVWILRLHPSGYVTSPSHLASWGHNTAPTCQLQALPDRSNHCWHMGPGHLLCCKRGTPTVPRRERINPTPRKYTVLTTWVALTVGPLSDPPLWFWLQRPYEIHSATPIDEILHMFKVERVHYSSTWCKGMVALLKKVRGQPPACQVWGLRAFSAEAGIPPKSRRREGTECQWWS